MNGVVSRTFNVWQDERQEGTEVGEIPHSGLPIRIDRCRAAAVFNCIHGAEEPFCGGTSRNGYVVYIGTLFVTEYR